MKHQPRRRKSPADEQPGESIGQASQRRVRGITERRTGRGTNAPRHGYYALKISGNLVVFAGAWVAFAFLGDSWWQLLIAALLAVLFAQLAFIGHDAGHKQIFRTRRPNDVFGTVHGGLGRDELPMVDQRTQLPSRESQP